jgi:hypothetical protein
MATIKREILSGSSNGLPEDLGTSQTEIHTIETTTADYEEVWVWLSNITTSQVVVTLQIGHDSNTDRRVMVKVPAESTVLAIPGWTFKGHAGPSVIKGATGSANQVNFSGYVNHIDDA